MRYDYVIFGATGFTGEYVVEELALTAGSRSWAVAGRDTGKLKQVLMRVSKRIGRDISDTECMKADVKDEQSLVEMAKQARVVLNVVGPYRFFGEPVVRACVENGASHVDISGEPIYLESMQLKYAQTAKDNGVYVVGSCGFDSVPADMGVVFARRQLGGDLNDAETTVEFKSGPEGSKVNFGTFHSMIYGVAHRSELPPLRKALFSEKLPRSVYKLPARKPLFYDERVGKWCLPFMGSDKSIVYRSQMYNWKNRDMKPTACNTWFAIGGLGTAIGLIFWGAMFLFMASFSFTRKLLENYPEIFSFGMFSKEGPSRIQVEGSSFSVWVFGRGWAESVQPNGEHASRPDLAVTVRVDGPDPGYLGTARMLVGCARTVLEDKSRLPSDGGVYTPASAFSETSLLERLEDRGVKFVVVDGPRQIAAKN